LKKTLVIGFGNVYRRDDGAGFFAINALRERLGRPPLEEDEDGLGDLGHEIDTLLLHQLVPELVDTVAQYDLVVFIDAHMGTIPELVRQEELEACYKSATVSHILHPCTLLAMARELYTRQPSGVLISVRGYDFEFGKGLSEQTAALIPETTERVWALAKGAK
jgi:hydrogenase maturation protease